MENEMNDENVKKLGTLIEALTHSGSNTLDEDIFKQIKKICKSLPVYIPKAYDLLLSQLKKKNSQIRYTAFQMCKELFNRSAVFREHVLKDLELIFKLTAEINSKSALPPPKSAAKNLKTLALKTLQIWVNEFGESYKKLKIAYNYFKNSKKINFETFEDRNDQIRLNEEEFRQRMINEEREKKVMEELKSYELEIERTITSLSNCVDLLLPPPENFFIPENNLCNNDASQETSFNSFNNGENEINNDLRTFGITRDYSLSLQVNTNDQIIIKKTEENSSIIENAKDCAQLITHRFLPLIKKWSNSLCKYSNRNCDNIKKILDIKEKLQKIMNKYNSIVIEGEENQSEKKISNNSDDDDDDFEEVKKEGYEDAVEFSEEDLLELYNSKKNEAKSSELKLKNIKSNSSALSVTSTSSTSQDEETASSMGTNKDSSLTDRKSKLLKVAPKLPFDIDLYHWEDETLTPPTLISTKMDIDNYWGCSGSEDIHEIQNPEGTAALRTRVIEFVGKFEPAKWACRFPLPSGKLCPRKDKFKCPFHGKIVPRDESGKCQNPEDEKNMKQITGKNSIPDWQDPQLLADLKASTGIDLKIPEKNSKKKKLENENLTHRKMKTSTSALRIVRSKNFPGLEDVIRKRNSSYTRLSKKIFNRSALKRTSAALNKIDKKKFLDKFGDNFNY